MNLTFKSISNKPFDIVVNDSITINDLKDLLIPIIKEYRPDVTRETLDLIYSGSKLIDISIVKDVVTEKSVIIYHVRKIKNSVSLKSSTLQEDEVNLFDIANNHDEIKSKIMPKLFSKLIDIIENNRDEIVSQLRSIKDTCENTGEKIVFDKLLNEDNILSDICKFGGSSLFISEEINQTVDNLMTSDYGIDLSRYYDLMNVPCINDLDGLTDNDTVSNYSEYSNNQITEESTDNLTIISNSNIDSTRGISSNNDNVDNTSTEYYENNGNSDTDDNNSLDSSTNSEQEIVTSLGEDSDNNRNTIYPADYTDQNIRDIESMLVIGFNIDIVIELYEATNRDFIQMFNLLCN